MIGRLLQFGWHSRIDVKENGILESLKYTNSTYNDFEIMLNTLKIKNRNIIPIAILMGLAQLSFGSIFLVENVKKILFELIDSEDSNLFNASLLIFSIRELIEKKELEDFVNKLLERVKNNDIDVIEKGRILIILVLIEKNQLSHLKSVKRYLNKFSKRYPALLNKL